MKRLLFYINYKGTNGVDYNAWVWIDEKWDTSHQEIDYDWEIRNRLMREAPHIGIIYYTEKRENTTDALSSTLEVFEL